MMAEQHCGLLGQQGLLHVLSSMKINQVKIKNRSIMLINIKKTMTILSTLLLGIMCSFCSDTIDVYAGQYGEEEGTNEPETPEVVGKIVHIESLRNPDRGFHLECNLLADEMKSPYNDYEVYGDDF